MKRIVPVFLAVVTLCWLIGSADCSNNKTVADNQNDAYEIDLLASDSIHGVYATDTMDAYAELAPNDSSNGTYYYQGVPGHSLIITSRSWNFIQRLPRAFFAELIQCLGDGALFLITTPSPLFAPRTRTARKKSWMQLLAGPKIAFTKK